MDLQTALRMVIVDTREQNGDLTAVEATELARTCDHDDVNVAVDDPALRAAYRLVLDASDTEITHALAYADMSPA